MEDIQKTIEVRTLANGTSAIEINSPEHGRVFKISEVTLIGKIVKYKKGLFQPKCEYKAVIIGNDKIRII